MYYSTPHPTTTVFREEKIALQLKLCCRTPPKNEDHKHVHPPVPSVVVSDSYTRDGWWHTPALLREGGGIKAGLTCGVDGSESSDEDSESGHIVRLVCLSTAGGSARRELHDVLVTGNKRRGSQGKQSGA